MVATLQIRRDSCENWYNNNPILLSNELGYDTTHNRIKIGDGIHYWNDLEYIDKKYNDSEIRTMLGNVYEIELPKKADKDNVYTKAEINDMKLVSEDELIAKNYVNKDEINTEFLTRCEADKLATRKEMQAADFEVVKMLDEKKADKSETYSKTEVDKKLAEIEFCHHRYNRWYNCKNDCYHFGLDGIYVDTCTPYDVPEYLKHPICDCDKPELPEDKPCDCTDKLFASVYVKGEVDALLEKKADQRFVNMGLSTKADISYVDAKLINDYYTIEDIDKIIRQLTGEDITSFVTKDELQELTNKLESNYLTKEDVEKLIESITNVNVSSFALKEDVDKELVKKADKEIVKQALELKADKNDLKEMVSYKPFANDRKTIELPNHWTISGLDVTGIGYNLAMLSKWNVADFGSQQIHMNLNTVDTVTINDDKIVATTVDIENAVAPKADKETVDKQFENIYTKEEVDGLNKYVKDIAESAKTTVADISADLSSKYMLKDETLTYIKHLEDEIATVGKTVTKIIEVLESKGIIDKGSIDHKYYY